MSHLTAVEAKVTDLNTLSKALEAFPGCELVRGQKTHTYYGQQQGTCEHAIKVKGTTYEIGLVKRTDGGRGWDLSYDNWYSGGLDKMFGSKLTKLKIEIAKVETIKQMKKAGFSIKYTTDAATGKIEMKAWRLR